MLNNTLALLCHNNLLKIRQVVNCRVSKKGIAYKEERCFCVLCKNEIKMKETKIARAYSVIAG
jgi:hypothetical protein